MKNKDLFDQIKRQVALEAPDIQDRISLDSIRIGQRTEPKQRRIAFHGRLVMTVLILALLTVSSYFLFFQNNNQTVYALEGEVETISYQVLSGSMFLQNETSFDSVIPLSNVLLSEEETYFEQNQSLFSQSFAVLESLIGDRDQILFQAVASDQSQYQQKVLITLKDLNEQDVIYEVYFNQRIRKNVQSLSGMVSFQDTSFQFTYQRLQGTELSRIRIERDNQAILVVKHVTDQDTLRFRYEYMEGNEVARSFFLNVSKQENQVKAAMVLSVQGKLLTINMERRHDQSQSSLKATYRFLSNNQEVESGDIDLTSEYDEEVQKFQYRYQVRTRIGDIEKIQDIIENKPPRGNQPTRPNPPGRP